MAHVDGNGTVTVYHDSIGVLQVCVQDDRSVGSHGMFYGDNPLEYVLPITLCQIFIHNILSRLIYFLLKPIKTPKFMSHVIAGIILGPSGLGRSQKYWNVLFPPRQAAFLQLFSLVGGLYYTFIVTLKMDIATTIRASKNTWKLGVIPYLSSFIVITTLLGFYYEYEQNPHLESPMVRTFIGASMSFSYFPVVADALMEFNLIATEVGQIAMSSAMFNDILQWLMVIVRRVVNAGSLKSATMAFMFQLFFFSFCIFSIRPLMKMIVRRTPVGKPVKEIYIVSTLLGVLVMACLTDLIGISIFLGPILFGLITPSGTPLGKTLVDKSELIIQRLILPFFFIDIGMRTNLPVLQNWSEIISVQCILLAGYLTKMLACVLVSMSYNIRPKNGVLLGLIMNLKGINELLFFSKMRERKVLDEETYTHLVICVVGMTVIMSPFVKLLYMHRPRVQHASDIGNMRVRSILNTPRNTEFRIITCIHHESNVSGMIALLEACNPILESPICTYVIQLVEIMGQAAPILLSINYKQNKKIMHLNYPDTDHIMRAFDNYANNSSGPITIVPYVNVAHYKNMHESVCNLAKDKIVPFIVIPFHENDNLDIDGHVSRSIQKLNTKFQSRAPCTVGILVDRNSRLGSNDNSNLIFHVGIFFVGGKDDREALALGIRMTQRENVMVTLFRFVVTSSSNNNNNNNKVGDDDDDGIRIETNKEKEEEEEVEEMLNESLIEEFKSMKFARGNVCWYEIMVVDIVGIMDTIRSLEGHYDLVMVGKRHNIGTLNDEEMTIFIENVETLGMLGDMLSSTEFCNGMVPVLVTQCGGVGESVVHKNNNKLSRIGSTATSQRSINVIK